MWISFNTHLTMLKEKDGMVPHILTLTLPLKSAPRLVHSTVIRCPEACSPTYGTCNLEKGI